MTDADDDRSQDQATNGEGDGDTQPALLGRWRVARFHLDATEDKNTIDLAPSFPFSC